MTHEQLAAALEQHADAINSLVAPRCHRRGLLLPIWPLLAINGLLLDLAEKVRAQAPTDTIKKALAAGGQKIEPKETPHATHP